MRASARPYPGVPPEDLGRALWACKELALLRHLVAICKNTRRLIVGLLDCRLCELGALLMLVDPLVTTSWVKQ